MIMTIVEKLAGEFPFWFITQRECVAALILLWASSGGLGAMR